MTWRVWSSVVLFTTILAVSGVLRAADCPSCPSGCIPEGAVETYRPGAENAIDDCPPGCIGLSRVRLLKETPICGPAPAIPAPPGAPAAAPVSTPVIRAPESDENQWGTRYRITAMPTAIGLDPSEYRISGYGFGLWELQMGVTEHIQLGIMTLLPVMVGGIAGTAEFHWDVTDRLSLGMGIATGYMGMFALDDFGSWVLGGSLLATYAFDRVIFNIGLVGGTLGYHTEKWYDPPGGLLMPTLGMRWAVSRNWALNLELLVPLLVDDDEACNYENLTVLFFYGARVHGEILFGDFGFMVPLSEWYYDYIARFAPMGFPYFSLGFMF